jgi:hypothetical protein
MTLKYKCVSLSFCFKIYEKTFIHLYLACIEEGVCVSPHNDVNVWDRLRHFDI